MCITTESWGSTRVCMRTEFRESFLPRSVTHAYKLKVCSKPPTCLVNCRCGRWRRRLPPSGFFALVRSARAWGSLWPAAGLDSTVPVAPGVVDDVIAASWGLTMGSPRCNWCRRRRPGFDSPCRSHLKECFSGRKMPKPRPIALQVNEQRHQATPSLRSLVRIRIET